MQAAPSFFTSFLATFLPTVEWGTQWLLLPCITHSVIGGCGRGRDVGMFPGTQSEFRGNSETSCANEVGTVQTG